MDLLSNDSGRSNGAGATSRGVTDAEVMQGSITGNSGDGVTDAGKARARYNGGVILMGLMNHDLDGSASASKESRAEEALEMFSAAIDLQP